MPADPRKQLKKLADDMDLKSESHNAHDFVVTHRALAVLMTEQLGVESTLKVFKAIKKESKGDGLPGLTGVAGTGPDVQFLKRRGIATNWGAWQIPG